MNQRITITVLFIALSLSAFCQTGNLVEKGQQAPDLSFTKDDGTTIKMSDQKGKVVLINFFATWCGPCMAEMPSLQEKVWMKYNDNAKFVMMSFGRGHTQAEVKTFKESKQLGFPVYPDTDKSIYGKFATQYIPRNYIIDTNGTIVYASTGYSPEEFEAMIIVLNGLLK
jgi:peroxiredoxin